MPTAPAQAPAHDAREARRLDLNADALGVPVQRLMGNAGKAVAREAARHAPKGAAVLLLCGKGNNGGDGFAAAAELRAMGRDARVLLAEPPGRIASDAARHHFARLPREAWAVWRGKPPAEWPAPKALVDCLLGSGLAGPPRGPYAAMVRWLNAQRSARRPVVACDVPSGWGTAVAVRPTVTVALHAAQPGLTPKAAGQVKVAPIGIPASARGVGFGDAVLGYPEVQPGSHKGDNGLVLVVAGSLPLAGAPHYVALGAARTGADVVHLAAPEGLAPLLRSWGPDAIVHGVPGPVRLTPDAVPAISALLRRCSALAIGPGLGQHPSTLAATWMVLSEAADLGLPAVVDADGLDALDDGLLSRHGARMVLTPHAREFLDLSGKEATRANVAAYARRHGTTVLRKGAVDVVAGPALARESRGGHPAMTKGGTGDVLTGIVAALLSKGAPPFEAACAASHLSKAAGEVAASVRSYGATAVDVAEAIPAVVARIEAAQGR